MKHGYEWTKIKHLKIKTKARKRASNIIISQHQQMVLYSTQRNFTSSNQIRQQSNFKSTFLRVLQKTKTFFKRIVENLLVSVEMHFFFFKKSFDKYWKYARLIAHFYFILRICRFFPSLSSLYVYVNAFSVSEWMRFVYFYGR